MPFEMSGFIQAVVAEEAVYVGGGSADNSDNNCVVMKYDTRSECWSTLPQYRARDFGMSVINNKLVLVGGFCRGNASKKLGVWKEDWSHPYPKMRTARACCSAAFHRKWLVVAGGINEGRILSSIDILNIETQKWEDGPELPTPQTEMKAVIVGDTYYCLGGFNDGRVTDNVYSASIETLTDSKKEGWKVITGLQLIRSVPLSFNGSLFVVGGVSKARKAVTAVHLYRPDAGEWVKVKDLLSPRSECACAQISDYEVMIAGGWNWLAKSTNRVDFAVL